MEEKVVSMAAVKDWRREAWGGTGGREERKGSGWEGRGRGSQGARESGEWGQQRESEDGIGVGFRA